MMTNNEVLQAAMQQSAWDMNCNPDVFLKDEPVLVTSNIGEKAKKYYKEPIACNFISYGSNIVVAAKTAIKAGFCPGWVEMTVKPAEVVDEMNK